MKIFATYNIKGGVGKTSAAVNLSYLAARDGLRTLLWDLDAQGAASYILRVKPRVKGGGKALVRGRRTLGDAVKGTDFERLDVLPSDFTYRNLDLALDSTKRSDRRLARLLDPVADDYDVVMLDSPPGISLVSENVLNAADTVLVPLVPTTLSTRTLDQLTEFLSEQDQHRPRLLAFFSMVDRRKRLHRDILEQLPKLRDDVATAAIPALSLVEQMSVQREPLPFFAARSSVSQAYEALWREALARTPGQPAPPGLSEGR